MSFINSWRKKGQAVPAATESLAQTKQLLTEAEHAAEESIISFLKNLNDLARFDVVGSRDGDPLTDSSKDFYIFHDLGKDVDPALSADNLFSRDEPVMSLHIGRKSPVAYSSGPNPDPNKQGDPRYILIENFEGGITRAKCSGNKSQADMHLRAYQQEMANVFYTSYMPDVAEKIAYSMPQIGKGHIKDLRPMIETLQQNFQERFSKAYEQHLRVPESARMVSYQNRPFI